MHLLYFFTIYRLSKVLLHKTIKLYFKVFNNLISHEYQSSVFESEYFLSPKVTKTKRIHINKTLRVKKEATKSKKELLQIQANLIAA